MIEDLEKSPRNSEGKSSALDPAVDIRETRSDSTDTEGFLAKGERVMAKLEAKLGMETRGIERVPEDQRFDTNLSGSATIWLAANCVLPTFGIGVLGPQIFGLGLGDSLLAIAFTNIATCFLPAYMAVFGPKLGLRQMTSARYSWGFYGARIVALLNCIACVGWSAVNTIAGAQTLRVIADDTISHAVGVVIIAMITLALGLFGYKYIHHYERWSWVPTAITFIVLLGCGAKHLANTPMGTGEAEAASVLSFMGTVFGFAVGWTSLASDYNVYQPADTPQWKTFAITYSGLIFPLILCQWLGAAIMSAATVTPEWFEQLQVNEIGGLIGAVFRPVLGKGGAGFFMFLLVISVVANNIINVYSLGLSISVIGSWFSRLPRLIWPVLCTGIYIPVAIVGANSFALSLQYFMDVLGYWLAIFVTVVLEEHFIFRKGNWARYDVENTWNVSSSLPIGFGAFAAFCAGAAGTALGMSQTWWTGPIGGSFGPMGGDIGFELSGGFAAVVYPVARWAEIKYFGR